jgi:hypothetical protein
MSTVVPFRFVTRPATIRAVNTGVRLFADHYVISESDIDRIAADACKCATKGKSAAKSISNAIAQIRMYSHGRMA